MLGLDGFQDNLPRDVRCVHPLVTLLEKLDALHRRFPSQTEPAKFVRHYEDAAHVISAMAQLPPLPNGDVKALADDLLSHRHIVGHPSPSDPAFSPDSDVRWTSVRAAHSAIGNMFWGARISLEESCKVIRDWAAAHFE